jgi:hypothetical protein
MRHAVYVVFDTKAAAFHPPFISANEAVALRLMTDLVNNPDHLYGRHAEDFRLFHLGTWDDNSSLYDLNTPTDILGLFQLRREE